MSLLGRLAKPSVFATPFAIIPVLFVVHSSIEFQGGLVTSKGYPSPHVKDIGQEDVVDQVGPDCWIMDEDRMRTGIFSTLGSFSLPIPYLCCFNGPRRQDDFFASLHGR